MDLKRNIKVSCDLVHKHKNIYFEAGSDSIGNHKKVGTVEAV